MATTNGRIGCDDLTHCKNRFVFTRSCDQWFKWTHKRHIIASGPVCTRQARVDGDDGCKVVGAESISMVRFGTRAGISDYCMHGQCSDRDEGGHETRWIAEGKG